MWGARVCALMALLACTSGCSWIGGSKKPVVTPGTKPRQVLPTTRYEVELQLAVEPKAGARKLMLWVPLPPGSAFQKETDRRVVPTPRYRFRTSTDSSQNPLLAWSVEQPRAMRVSLFLTVDRTEARLTLDPARTRQITPADRLDHRPWLAQAIGIPVDDRLRDLTGSIVGAQTNPLMQARALFDWLGRNIGWREPTGASTGDASRALDTLAGDSADLAALFVALCRSAGLPARTCRGTNWPTAPAGQPLVVSEQWWAELWVPNLGWIPVDPAGQARSRDDKRVYFGRLDRARLLWARGRDLLLEPRQAADPIDAVRGAWAEVDGEKITVSTQMIVRVAKPRLPKTSAPKKKKPTSPKPKPKKKGKK